jgi:uncharacterized protein YjiS (DUF1127 family)
MHHTDWTRDETLADLIGLSPDERALEPATLEPPVLSVEEPPRRCKRSLIHRAGKWLVHSYAAYAWFGHPGLAIGILQSMPQQCSTKQHNRAMLERAALKQNVTVAIPIQARPSLMTKLRRWRESRKQSGRTPSLSRADEALLRDMGLPRREIDRIAWNERFLR